MAELSRQDLITERDSLNRLYGEKIWELNKLQGRLELLNEQITRLGTEKDQRQKRKDTEKLNGTAVDQY